jgi:hypothetical protein
MGGLFENKPWARYSEYLRLLALAPVGYFMMIQVKTSFLIILLIFTILSLLHFSLSRRALK